MISVSEVDRLAAHAGIEADYHDDWGNLRTVPRTTKAALLAAMGLPADNDEVARETLTRLEDASWRQALPPVLVWRRRRGEVPSVPVTLPETGTGGRFLWSLETETGRALQGEGWIADLPVQECRKIGAARLARRLLTVSVVPPLGYHRFRLFVGDSAHAMPLVVVPRQCYLPRASGHDGRMWGIAIQLYGLRSHTNWGIGDFGDLNRLVGLAGELGADAIGLNPLHALFPSSPAQASPYSPSSRRWLNMLYIDVPSVPDYAECAEARNLVRSEDFATDLRTLRESALVDYSGVAQAKARALELLYGSFRERHLGGGTEAETSERGSAFRRFQAANGDALEHHGVFEALAERFGTSRWSEWPPAYRDPDSPDVSAFAESDRQRVEYYQYLQWVADDQLRRARAATHACGMDVGLYHDLALGVDGNGSEAWRDAGLYAAGATIGAPPDAWNRQGQNWGMPPANPKSLRARGFAPFSEVLAANMRHGGALRLDHVMSLQRLYWIPAGAAPAEGAYVRQPVDEMFGILALESRRQRCMVIGEDLGTVPSDFRARMRDARVLSYRLIYFHQDETGALAPPKAFPRLSAAVVGTHDLATLPGFWTGRDLELRTELGLYPSRELEQQARSQRESFRRALLAALTREGLSSLSVADDDNLPDETVRAVYAYLARSPARLVMVHLEDVLDVTEQPNLPGTVDEHPNWRRRLPLAVEHMRRDPRLRALAATIRESRKGGYGN